MLLCFLQANPFVRFVVPLIVGILLGDFVKVEVELLFYLLLFLTLLLFLFQQKIRRFRGWLLLFIIIIFGVLLVQYSNEKYAPPNDISTHFAKAIVRNEPEEKEQKTVVLLEIVALQKEQDVLTEKFNVIAYLPKDSTLQSWNYGDTIIGRFQFFPLQHNTNPFAFDYAELLRKRYIYYSANAKMNELEHLSSQSFSLVGYSHFMQKKLREILDSYIPNKNASGFLQAMTLGDKTSLSSEVQVDFADAGVVHILAVSGLHVGILFLLINIIFHPLKATKFGRLLLFLIGILVIWSFAFISGLSVSIQRAAVMFTLMQFNVLFLRPYQIYNTIALSAFAILCYNPYNLYEVGFQLSYCAVLGIVTFVSMWNGRELKNRFLEKLKQMVLVSLAAQLGVAPLMLYYFHHLPTYFLLGNIIVLFLAPFLLGGSLLILLFSEVVVVAKFLGIIVSGLTVFCINSVNLIAKLPNSILIDYPLQLHQVILLYLLMISVLFYIIKRRERYFYLLLCFVLGFVLSVQYRSFQENNQSVFVVHQVRNITCYSLLSGRDAVLFSNKTLAPKIIKYTVIPLWDAKRIENQKQIKLSDTTRLEMKTACYESNYLKIKDKIVVFCPENMQQIDQPQPIDVLLLSAKSDWEVALQNFSPQQIVLDNSFSKRKSQKLRKEFLALQLSVHNVATDGAFILDYSK